MHGNLNICLEYLLNNTTSTNHNQKKDKKHYLLKKQNYATFRIPQQIQMLENSVQDTKFTDNREGSTLVHLT